MVILEPDGLGIIPWYDPYAGADGTSALEWCQPTEADPESAAAERFAMLGYAVDALKARPNVNLYLDGTHSAWLGVEDAAHRLVQAGVERADGFFVNVIELPVHDQLRPSRYLDLAVHRLRNDRECGRFRGLPEPVLEWRTAPSHDRRAARRVDRRGAHAIWGVERPALVPERNTSGLNLRYANMLGAVPVATHFVVDTSRNGLGGRGSPHRGHVHRTRQDWCNPP